MHGVYVLFLDSGWIKSREHLILISTLPSYFMCLQPNWYQLVAWPLTLKFKERNFSSLNWKMTDKWTHGTTADSNTITIYSWNLLTWSWWDQRKYFEYECPESYCRTPGVGVGVRVRVRVHKNFNLAYNSWTTIGRAFISHMCIPCDKTFPWVPKFLT